MTQTLQIVVLALLVTAVAALVFVLALLRAKGEACERLLAEKDAACDKMLKEKDAAVARLVAEREKSFGQVVVTLREQFANLAAQTLKAQGGDLAKLNKDQLETVLAPLREQVARLRESTLKAEADRSSMKSAIAENVGAIGAIADELAKTASALASNTRVQGRKGEDILAEKLRQAGLELNVNFFLQEGTGRERPDAQVCDTENRWLVIDSKVSLTAYMEYACAKSDDVRRARLKAHVASVRERISELARVKYPKTLGDEHPERSYLPVTAMFVPYEAPLLEALREDGSLWQYAAQNNVVLVTPLTLLAYMRLVYLAWQHQKELDNQHEIVNTARELLTRMNAFLMAFEGIGGAIESLRQVYADAGATLVDSPRAQTIAKAANRLIDLHVRLESRKGRRLEKAACLQSC